MVGHVKDGYEGYNSTPSSPTKYTVNHHRGASDDDVAVAGGGGKWIVSRLCILLTAIVFALALVAVFLVGHYLVPRRCACDASPATLPQPTIANGFNLTDDQLPIDIMSDDDDNNLGETQPAVADKRSELQQQQQRSVSFRLPTGVRPVHYRLKLIPFVEDKNLTTYGEVIITVQCQEASQFIVLNAKDIDVKNIKVTHLNSSNAELKILNIKENTDFEQIEIGMNEPLTANEFYDVSIVFIGKIRTVSNGLYRSDYIDSLTKQKSWIINTLFSPTYARYAYPCFDEPLFKAKFTMSLGRMMDSMTLSNTNISYSEPITGMDGWIWDHYHDTPVMSTYLTAFIIAPAKALMKNKADRLEPPEIKLWARPDDAYQTEFPIQLSEKILTFFEKYFDMKFPLSKIDIVGVPAHDYNAMENWGLIIFREGTLLVGEASSIKMQQSLALMLAHEFAHQWFGNLVTPKWWDELWLKEGLSTYFQCLSVDSLMPEWNSFEEFVLNEMDSAFQKDSLLTSPSISRNVDQPNKEIFNDISYYKGSSLIRMMANFMDRKTLKSGFINYLKKYAYSNANQDELWSSLTEEGFKYDGNKTVALKTIMDSWTSQAGYPVVTMTRNNGTNSATLTQERFLFDKKSNKSALWWIPISYTTSVEKNFNDTTPKLWLPGESKAVLSGLPESSKKEWVLLNLQMTGFYRVNYDNNNWIALIQDFTKLPLLNRAQLISDAFNLARGGQLSYSIAFLLSNELAREVNYIPWKAAITPLMNLRNFLIKMPAYGNFKHYLFLLSWRVYNSLVSDPIEVVPWKIPTDGTYPVKQMLIENVIGMSCLMKYSHCATTANDLFDSWKRSSDETNLIPETVRSIVYCTAIRDGSDKDWEFVYNKFYKASQEGARFGADQESLVNALGCSSEQWLLTKALGLIMKPNSGLSKEEGVILFKSVASNNIGHWLAVSFIQAQWKQLIEIHKNPSLVYEMVKSIVSYINTPNDVKLLKNLIIEIREYTKEDSLMLRQAVEVAEDNIVWMERNYLYVENWLQLFNDRYGSNGAD